MNRINPSAWWHALGPGSAVAFRSGPPPPSLFLLAIAFVLLAGFARGQSGTWQSTDINTASPGTTGVSGGTVVLRGSGADIWDTADSFRFHSQLVTGDATLVARVSSLENTDDWAKAGLMIRDSLDPTARNVFVGLTPSWHGGVLQMRSEEGGLTEAWPGPTGGVPSWLRLDRHGAEITIGTSSDGVTWTPLDLPQALTLNSAIYLGLAVSSHDPETLGAVTFDQVELTTSAPPDPPPPTGVEWAGRDIGAVGATGFSTENGGGGVTVTGSGDDIYARADAFQFYARPLTGDGEIVARVTSIEHTHDWAKAGLMMRASEDPGAPMAFIAVNAFFGVTGEIRQTQGGGTGSSGSASGTAPTWLKVVRVGNTFMTYFSTDGATWRSGMGSTIDLPETILVGLATTSHVAGTLCRATFDEVSVVDRTTPPPSSNGSIASPANLDATPVSPSAVQLHWTDRSDNETAFIIERSSDGEAFAEIARTGDDVTGYLDQTVTSGRLYWYRVRADNATELSAYSNRDTADVPSNDSDWRQYDIGRYGLPGTSTANRLDLTVTGSGEDIWGTADGFHFVYKRFGGELELRAKVESLEDTHPWAKVGLMMRDTLEPGSRHVFLGLTPGNGVGLFDRDDSDGDTVVTPGPGITAPYWIKLVRSGDVFTGYISPDGLAWEAMASRTVVMPYTLYLGVAVTAHDTSALNHAVLKSVNAGSNNPL